MHMRRLAASVSRRRSSWSARHSRGGLLLEAVIGVTLLTLIGAAVLGGLSTAHFSGARTEYQSTAENVARNQMEYALTLPYQPPPYNYPTVDPPAGYEVTAVAEEYVVADSNIEKVVVTVNHDGQQVLVLETLRARE